MLCWIKKKFAALSKEELYQILRFRMTVFILEQKSFYLDLDGIDQEATHFMGLNQNKLIAYARVNQATSTAYIRRVAVHHDFRKQGIGAQLMEQLLSFTDRLKNVKIVELDAQYHLQSFYASYGFYSVDKPYEDGGILHIRMLKETCKSHRIRV